MDPKTAHAVQAIAQNLQPHFWPQGIVDWAQLLLVLFTFLTLLVLGVYTIETVRLRKATRDQVDVTNRLLRESQIQNEHLLVPIVVLTTSLEGDRNLFVVKNTGTGPALNTRTSPFSVSQTINLRFRHRTVIGADQQQTAPLYMDSRPGSLQPQELVNILRQQAPDQELRTSIVYQSVSNTWYETTHTIVLTP